MKETEVSFKSGNETLAGTLTLPEGLRRPPIVVFVHGSGPLDRDQNTKLIKLNVFNTLAITLAKQGIGSLRYDKRGCGKSTGKYHETGHFDLVEDAENVFEFVKQQTDTPLGSIFIAGHSEGTIIAPQIASRRRDVDGIILIAPFLQKLDDVLMRQAAHMSADLKTMPGIGGVVSPFVIKLLGGIEKQQMQTVEKLKNSKADTVRIQMQKAPAKWFRELFSLDPREIYEKIDVPTLIIAGGKDLQCAPEDALEIARIVGEQAECHVVDNLTHILRTDEEPASFTGYKKLLKRPMDPIVGELLVDWLVRQNR